MWPMRCLQGNGEPAQAGNVEISESNVGSLRQSFGPGGQQDRSAASPELRHHQNCGITVLPDRVREAEEVDHARHDLVDDLVEGHHDHRPAWVQEALRKVANNRRLHPAGAARLAQHIIEEAG